MRGGSVLDLLVLFMKSVLGVNFDGLECSELLGHGLKALILGLDLLL